MADSLANDLAADEAKFAEYSEALLAAVEARFDDWIVGLITSRAGDSADVLDRAQTAAGEARATVLPNLAALLRTDLDDQQANPLQILRRAVIWPNQALSDLGIAAPQRDEFAQRSFPEDTHNLSPATFGDIAESLAEPGLVWGAAKAHVHLRRRREATALTPVPSCAFFAPDLMDQSKIRGALPDATVVRSPAQLSSTGADIVIVDLGRPAVFDHLADISGTVIGFGSHVDQDILERGRALGLAEVIARSVFFRRLQACNGNAAAVLKDQSN